MFSFQGPVILSKSWVNRAQVINYFNPQLNLNLKADSEDVIFLRQALLQLNELKHKQKGTFDLGLGGTSFRFFCFLVSRFEGEWVVQAHPRLIKRPQQEMADILSQLGVQCEKVKNFWIIKSKGWMTNSVIECRPDSSSQFVSGLLLSAWNLSEELRIRILKPITSFSYLQMTMTMLRQAGMGIHLNEDENFFEVVIPAHAKAASDSFDAELDVSSLFSLAAAAAVNGRADVTNWTGSTSQPDQVFLQLFQKMRIPFQIEANRFKISRCEEWLGIDANLQNCPDLFPVLAALCSLANGDSHLYGAAQLRHKESDRISKTAELLKLVGCQCEILSDGLKIRGQGRRVRLFEKQMFDPSHDHRMAMAAAVLILAGHSLEVTDRAVVQKSYPSFWKDIGL